MSSSTSQKQPAASTAAVVPAVKAPAQSETASHRFMAYMGPMGQVIKSLVRYLAYSSDVGEAFRPVVHRNVVRGAYALSWMYVLGDVSYDAYDKYTRLEIRGGDLAHTTSKRAVFQTVASMALPAFTIHSVVHYSKSWIFKPYLPQYVRWGPTISGLCVVPALPFMFDHPVEHACEFLWMGFVPLSDAARAKLLREEALHHAQEHGHGHSEAHGSTTTTPAGAEKKASH